MCAREVALGVSGIDSEQCSMAQNVGKKYPRNKPAVTFGIGTLYTSRISVASQLINCSCLKAAFSRRFDAFPEIRGFSKKYFPCSRVQIG